MSTKQFQWVSTERLVISSSGRWYLSQRIVYCSHVTLFTDFGIGGSLNVGGPWLYPVGTPLIRHCTQTSMKRVRAAFNNVYQIVQYTPRNVSVRPHQVSHCVRTFDWEKNETFEQIVATLKAAYIKKKNNVYARHLLVSHNQQPGESITELRKRWKMKALAKECTVGL